MEYRVLVVDDDRSLSEMIGIVLGEHGIRTTNAYDGPAAVDEFERSDPDLVLLDVMLPGFDGIEVCRRLRERSDVPIVMLSARTETDDVVRGLEAGADDYVVKPFKPAELIARVAARLRRIDTSEGAVFHLGELTVDTRSHEVSLDGSPVQLTPLEFDLLATLVANPSRVFTREELLDRVWGYRYKADTRLVNVHVQRLRAKIERDPDHPRFVITVRGVGYRAGE